MMQRYVLVGVMGCIVTTFMCAWSFGLARSHSLKVIPAEARESVPDEVSGTALGGSETVAAKLPVVHPERQAEMDAMPAGLREVVDMVSQAGM